MTRELIVVYIRPLCYCNCNYFIVERCNIEGNSIVVVDNVDDATDRPISTDIIYNGKI